jgi:hypothetical protein
MLCLHTDLSSQSIIVRLAGLQAIGRISKMLEPLYIKTDREYGNNNDRMSSVKHMHACSWLC